MFSYKTTGGQTVKTASGDSKLVLLHRGHQFQVSEEFMADSEEIGLPFMQKALLPMEYGLGLGEV